MSLMKGLAQRLSGQNGVLQFCFFSCTRCYTSIVSKQVSLKRTTSFVRHSSSTVDGWNVYPLKSRGLIQLTGADVVPLLQGLVTSDVTLLGEEQRAQCSFLLNVQGRVMYDLLLYDLSEIRGSNCVLVECEADAVPSLITDIKKYKIRKKVQIDNMTDKLQVLAGIPSISTSLSLPFGKTVVMETMDPRVPSFGVRAIKELTQSLEIPEEETANGYHQRRYEWGIPEGMTDLPPGNCFPLESNLVFMNGVSFSKGCYLGQELTARTHHTGVTRKRIMPLRFTSEPDDTEPGATIRNEKGRSVGKLRSHGGLRGLGLMRTEMAVGPLSVETKSGASVGVSAFVPSWWPEQTLK